MAQQPFSALPIFQGPMCLISTSEDGKLQVEQGPLEQIKQIDAPLVVVAIAGLTRTGKSYLLNRMAGSNSGFPLGKTIESKTKGIWVWCRKHPNKPNTVLLLLDTEGLGDVAKGDPDHDNKIFTVAALLSNVLLYNMMTAFNQDAVEKLTFITEMSKNIQFRDAKGGLNEEDLGQILPTFVLCLRDFHLLLEKDGKKITPDEYLENSLQLKCGDDSSIMKYNRPRECIRKFFTKRKCFIFDSPGDRNTLKNLESVPSEKLSESFIEETELFLEYIYTCNPKVLISSKAVNGRMFVSLVETYVTEIRNGAVPDVDDAIMVVAKLENERMASKAVQLFEAKMKVIQFPILKTEKLEGLYQEIQETALTEFRKESMLDAEKFEKQAVSEMDKVWGKLKVDNLQLVRECCESELKTLYTKTIGAKRTQGKYKVAGGYPLYRLDMEAVKKDYMAYVNNEGVDVFEAQQVLINSIDTESEIERDIMREDQRMTRQDRKRELERIQTENKAAEQEQRDIFESKLEKEKARVEKHEMKMEKQRKAYVKEQEEKLADIQQLFEQEKEISEMTIQMMREESGAQKAEFQEKIYKMEADLKKKEEDNRKKYEQILEEENVKAEERINRVQYQFETELHAEKKSAAKREKKLRLKIEEIEDESEDRKHMENRYKRKMEEYSAKLEKLKKESKEREEELKNEIKQLELERDALKEKVKELGLSVWDWIPVANLVVRAVKE